MPSARIIPPALYREVHGMEPEEEILLVNPEIAEAFYRDKEGVPA